MNEFTMGTQLFFGKDALNQLSNHTMKCVLIICDPFMAESHKVDLISDLLGKQGSRYQIFSKVVPDPSIEVVAGSIAMMNDLKPDVVIAFGGGSAIDTAKAACQIYAQSQHVAQPELIAIPTTSGTGSEVTSFAVISDPEKKGKYPLINDDLIPDVAILDPQFTASVPPKVTADTGMDVLTHVLEAYVSTQASDFTDACGEKAARLVWSNLLKAYREGADLEAREKMHNASCLAGIAFNGASLGICHSLAHAMGATFHVPHGRANAMLLPHVITFNAGLETAQSNETLQRYIEIAHILGISAGTECATVYGLINRIKQLMHQMAMPTTITDLGIDAETFKTAIPEMAEKALVDNCTKTNPRGVQIADLEALYLRVCKGGA